MESSWNQDGFYLLAVAALFAVICCLYCSKHSMEQENCGLLWHKPKQPLESSRVRKVGSGEGDVINCWKKPPCLGMRRAWHDSDGEGLRSGVGVFSRSVSPGLLPPGEGWGGSHDQLAGNSLQHVFFPHWLHIFLKNISTPSVCERLLRGRRNYWNIFLSFVTLETDFFFPPTRFVAQWLKSLAKFSFLNYWIHIFLYTGKSLKRS